MLNTNTTTEFGMVVGSHFTSSQEAEAGEVRLQGQPGLHNEFQASLNYTDSVPQNQGVVIYAYSPSTWGAEAELQ